MDIRLAYKEARKKIEDKYRTDLTKLDKSFEIFKELGFLDGEDNLFEGKLLVSVNKKLSKARIIKTAIDRAPDSFHVHDIRSIIQKDFPDSGLNDKYISSILFRLRKAGKVEIIDQGNRRDGYKYKKKGH